MLPYQHDISPLEAEEFFDGVDLDAAALTRHPLAFVPVMSGEQFQRVCNYAVVVEMWERAKCGRHRRAYLAEFTDAERKKIGSYHAKFWRWHLRTGTPRRVMMRFDTLALLVRACNFFGSI